MTNVSKITVNGNDYDIKDAEARSGLSNKQDTLVSGTNIKTVNGNSLLGSGDLTVSSEQVQSDWNVSDSSSMAYIVNKPTIPTTTSSITNNSTDALTSGGAYENLVTSVTAGTTANKLNVTKNGTTSTITINSVSSASTATSASYITGYLSKYVGKILTSGSAILENQLVYMYNGKIYPITSKTNNLNAEFGIQICTSAVSSSSSVYYFYLKQKTSITSLTNIPHATLSSGSKCYLRCTHDSSGNIKSDNYVTTSMSAGYTWYYIGQAISTTEIYVDTTNSSFISLNSDGEVFRINGKKIGTDLTLKTINNQSLIGTGNIVAGAINLRNNEELKLWQGTKLQWEQGFPITWYYWQSSITSSWTSGGAFPSSIKWDSIAYGDGNFVVIARNNWTTLYSSDNGATWNSTSITVGSGSDIITYGDNRFVVASYNNNTSAYSTDGGATWSAGGNLPSSATWNSIAYGDNRFVTVTYNTNKSAYSTDGGVTWSAGGNLPSNGEWNTLAYGDGTFVVVGYYTKKTAYSTDGGVTWSAGGNLPSEDLWTVTYGDNKFIAVAEHNNKTMYSTDGGATWSAGGNLPSSATWHSIAYGNGKFVTVSRNSIDSAYSTDGGATWSYSELPTSTYGYSVAYGNNKFVAITNQDNKSAIFTLQYDKCYTTDQNPTTSSIVYREPETTSSYTISSVSSGSITLSNNTTYNYNQNGNQYTYRTIGEEYPDYLCFINGVGIKIGNTLIASATPITTTITSTSTDTEAPSAKAVYDEIGEVESALNTINSGS